LTSAAVYDIEINQATNQTVVFTHGRGAFQFVTSRPRVNRSAVPILCKSPPVLDHRDVWSSCATSVLMLPCRPDNASLRE
jgi:hypothetical protein